MRKLPILQKKLSEPEVQPGKLIIGIAGSHMGAGTTHFGLMLASYFSEWAGRNTAYIEYSPKKNIRYLTEYLLGSPEENSIEKPLLYNHAIYYSSRKEQEAAEILSEDYDCVLLDLGREFQRYKNEFLRCDKRFIISSLTAWKRHELESFIRETQYTRSGSRWKYIIPFSTEKEVKQAAKEYGREIYRLPYEPDPFRLSRESLLFLQKIL